MSWPGGWRLRSRLRATASRVAATAVTRRGVKAGTTKESGRALFGREGLLVLGWGRMVIVCKA